MRGGEKKRRREEEEMRTGEMEIRTNKGERGRGRKKKNIKLECKKRGVGKVLWRLEHGEWRKKGRSPHTYFSSKHYGFAFYACLSFA